MKQKTITKKTPRKAASLGLAAIVLVIGLAAEGLAQTAHTRNSKKTAPQTDAEVSTQSAGQRAAIDPQTGRLRQPTPDEAQKLAEEMTRRLKRSPEKLTVTQQADGTEMVQLSEDYMEVIVVKLNPDGSLSTECVTGMETANKLIGADTKATASVAQTPAAIKAPVTKAAKSTKRKAVKRSTAAAGRKE
jgi:hypothetical protein